MFDMVHCGCFFSLATAFIKTTIYCSAARAFFYRVGDKLRKVARQEQD